MEDCGVQIKTSADARVLIRNQYSWNRLKVLYAAAPEEKKADQATAGQHKGDRFRH